MFADAFWPNFAFFALGQLVACLYLATGRLLRGGCLMLALLLLADITLVARFAYGADHVAVGALVVMQAYALLEAGSFAFGRWYRRQPHVLDRRRREYRAALVAELRGRDGDAATMLQALCRRDPWDVESTVGLACVQRRLGNVRRARHLLRRARRLDREARFADLIFLEGERLLAERDGAGEAAVTRAARGAAQEPAQSAR